MTPDSSVRKAQCLSKRIAWAGQRGSIFEKERSGAGTVTRKGNGNGDRKGDSDRIAAETGTGVEVREISQDESGDRAGTETELETIGRTLDGDGDGNTGGNGDGNKDGINDRKGNEIRE